MIKNYQIINQSILNNFKITIIPKFYHYYFIKYY
jgi:hypothetical protein